MPICKDCAKEKTRQYRETHPERVADYQRQYRKANAEKLAEYHCEYRNENAESIAATKRRYYLAHRDEILEKTKAYRLEHLEEFKEYQADWQRANLKANPEKYRAATHRRRNKIKANGGNFTAEEWQDICGYFGNACLSCGETGGLTVDHVIPLARGGSNSADNLQPLCGRCNSSKGTDLTDYRMEYVVTHYYSHF